MQFNAVLYITRVCFYADATSTAVDVSAEVANQRANVAREEERVKVCTAELEEASKATADSAASAQR